MGVRSITSFFRDRVPRPGLPDLPSPGLSLILFPGILLSMTAGAVPFTTNMNLAMADATYIGDGEGSIAGYRVWIGGDVDGDGLDDLLIGAPGDALQDAEVYLVRGMASGWDLGIPLPTADAWFYCSDDDSGLGHALSGGGDVNGDGYDDFLVGGPGDAYVLGRGFLFLGRPELWPPGSDVSVADTVLEGEGVQQMTGSSVALAGDVNADGFDDLVVGAPENSESGLYAGQTYLVLGHDGSWPGFLSLDAVDASFLGEQDDDRSGHAVAGAGDVNGDGFSDLIVSAPRNDEAGFDAGKTYLVFGQPSGWQMDSSLGLADASFLGEQGYDLAGWSVAGAGDSNGDGFDDFLIGAVCNIEGGVDYPNGSGCGAAGQAYLILGRPDEWIQGQSLAAADASFWGEAADDDAGDAVSGAGDVNGDGFDDLLVSGSHRDSGWAGKTWLVLGRDVGWSRDTVLSAAEASFFGEFPFDHAGRYGLSGGGDVNGDGLSDLLLGAPHSDDGGQAAGKAFVLLGRECFDSDADGYAGCDGDCDDTNPLVFPGAPEICDGLDNDCDGLLDPAEIPDSDGDGSPDCADCDDGDPAIYPGAEETCDDGIDSDCLGDLPQTEEDDDGDGYSECAGDCDDTDAGIHPGAAEQCNGVDDNCDGYPHGDELDCDGDGAMGCQGDCDDMDEDVGPGFPELCDLKDNDCDGDVDEGIDEDNDGYDGCGGPDCDDADPKRNPGAAEVPYNGLDEDCDGFDLEDVDGDGFPGMPAGGEDCDDENPEVHPFNAEVCTDGIDNDCDGNVDDADRECPADDPEPGGCTCSAATASVSGSATASLILVLAGFFSRRRSDL